MIKQLSSPSQGFSGILESNKGQLASTGDLVFWIKIHKNL